MSDLLLTSDKIDIHKFKEKYPTNILNITRDDIFKQSNIIQDSNIMCYNTDNKYSVYDSENLNQSLDKYQKLREDTIKVSMDEYNKMFQRNKNMLEKKIIDLSGQVSIESDPYRTKYTDTYSITPYATNLLTPLSGDDIDNVVSRFDDCFGTWNDGYFDNSNRKWHDYKKNQCYKDDGSLKNDCQKHKQVYKIANPDFSGEPCKNKNGEILEDGDIRHIYCNKDNKEKCKKK